MVQFKFWEGIVSTDSQRQLLRHAVAALAYRAGKALRGAPESFAGFQAGENGKTSVQILAHMGDLFDWALSMSQGRKEWRDATPQAWEKEIDRFFGTLKAFDDYLASDAVVHVSAEKLLQAPIADALTHTGQLAMMRRLAGFKISGESYYVADIVTGRVGFEQTPARKEF
jgi:hypothetical protein